MEMAIKECRQQSVDDRFFVMVTFWLLGILPFQLIVLLHMMWSSYIDMLRFIIFSIRKDGRLWAMNFDEKTVETWFNLAKLAKIDFSSPKSNKKTLKREWLEEKGSCGYVWKVISATRVRSTTEIVSRDLDLPRESRDWLGDKFCTPDQEQLIRDEKFRIF